MTATPSTQIPILNLEANPWNRKTFNAEGLEELAGSIKEHGIIEPIIARSHPTKTGKYQIIAGERRWRAAKIADLEKVPVIVRVATDKQLLELNQIENLQREDLDPIEEGKGLRRMMDEFGYTLEDLEKRLHKKKSAIYGSMKLANLCDRAATVFRAGGFGESVAQRIARLPSETLQIQFLERARVIDSKGKYIAQDVLTDRETSDTIARYFMRELKSAPFKQQDPELLAVILQGSERVGGGACTDCPMRSGNQPGFNPKNGRADVCLNPGCFLQKAKLAFDTKAVTHKEQGGGIVDGSKVFNKYGGINHEQQLEEANYHCYQGVKIPGRKADTYPTWAQIAAHLNITPTLALNPESGQIIPLLNRAAVMAAAQKAGIASGNARRSASAAEKAAKEKQRRARAIRAAQVGELAATLTKKIISEGKPPKIVTEFLALVVAELARHADADICKAIVKRRELDPAPNKGKYDDGIRKTVEKLGTTSQDPAPAVSLIAELLTIRQPYQADPLPAFANLARIDLNSISRTVSKTLDEKKPKAKPAAKKVKLAKKGAKGK